MTSRFALPWSPPTRFGLLAGACYLLWVGGYEHWLAPDGRLDAALTQNLAQTSAALLRALGWAVTASPAVSPVMHLGPQPLLGIAHPCNGLALYALFAGFVAAFAGPWRTKLWFMPLGLGILYALNVARIVALCLNAYYAQRTLAFNHHYTFTFLVYVATFGLWMWWATRLARPRTAGTYAA